MILYWATFAAILGCMSPAGCRLDTPGRMTPPAGLQLGTESEIISDKWKTLSHRKKRLSAIPTLVPPSSLDPVCPSPDIRLH